MSQKFELFVEQAKGLAGLTPELERCLQDIAPVILPRLEPVTDAFYTQLTSIPVTANFLQGCNITVSALKQTHARWLYTLFTQKIDMEFAHSMAKVGDTHVNIQLPLSFMAGAMNLINKELIVLVVTQFGDNPTNCIKALQAINAVTSFCLIIMQQSYQLWE